MDEQRREKVRGRYNARCGYCGVHETDTGATLTIDHHRPLAYGGTENDENLVYCCPRCNQHKGAYWHEIHVPSERFKEDLIRSMNFARVSAIYDSKWLLHIQFFRKQWVKLNVKPKQLKKTIR